MVSLAQIICKITWILVINGVYKSSGQVNICKIMEKPSKMFQLDTADKQAENLIYNRFFNTTLRVNQEKQ